MFKRTCHPAWMFLCAATLLLLSALSALAQVAPVGPTGGTDAATQQPATSAQQALPIAPVQRLHIFPVRRSQCCRHRSGCPCRRAPELLWWTNYFERPRGAGAVRKRLLQRTGCRNHLAHHGQVLWRHYRQQQRIVSLLNQYNTPVSGGTDQTFGNGTFGGLFQIVPSAGNNGSTITDAQIQSELLAQITAGHLPAPVLDAAGNPNTLYMIFFPPGKTITQGGSNSCRPGGFCAYHGTTSTLLNGKNVLYGVMPDMQSGLCSTGGCGNGGVFGNYTSVTSHELTEAITDADVGIATTFAPPLAWYDMVNGEIGDICNGQQGTYTANGTAYTIQLEFSNAANNCVLPPPAATGPDFSIAASPASQTVTQGGGTSYTATVTASGGFTGVVSFSVSGLPSGASASFNPTSVTGSGSSTMSVSTSSTTPAGTYTLTITGTSGTLSHSTTVRLVVNSVSPPDFTISVSPASLNVTRGSTGQYTVTIGAVNGFSGTVSLSVSGLGSRVTGTFSPTSVTGSGTSTLSVTAARNASRGARTITITGVSGSLSHSTTATLNVQ